MLTDEAGVAPGFRLSESPIFISKSFQNKLEETADSLIRQIDSFSAEELNKAIPDNNKVPGDDAHCHFLALDFGICQNASGAFEPQLIELQAFPSLYAFQYQYGLELRKIYPFLNQLQLRRNKEEYIRLFTEIIVGPEHPENVILLELFPEKQKTAIDFALTEKYLGIKTVGLTDILKEGRQLFYKNQGKKIPIKRIYNRVIFDELSHYPDLETQFHLTDEVDVTWVTHPNWFFKISKFILPRLNHRYVPKSYYLKEAPRDLNLSDYVLKPLFSFAGSGINLHPTKQDLDNIKDPQNFILQKKVKYAPAFLDINGDYSKAEIRMLFGRPEGEKKPQLMVHIVRMTKAEMVSVDLNKTGSIWIGSSAAFFEGDL